MRPRRFLATTAPRLRMNDESVISDAALGITSASRNDGHLPHGRVHETSMNRSGRRAVRICASSWKRRVRKRTPPPVQLQMLRLVNRMVVALPLLLRLLPVNVLQVLGRRRSLKAGRVTASGRLVPAGLTLWRQAWAYRRWGGKLRRRRLLLPSQRRLERQLRRAGRRPLRHSVDPRGLC